MTRKTIIDITIQGYADKVLPDDPLVAGRWLPADKFWPNVVRVTIRRRPFDLFPLPDGSNPVYMDEDSTRTYTTTLQNVARLYNAWMRKARAWPAGATIYGRTPDNPDEPEEKRGRALYPPGRGKIHKV